MSSLVGRECLVVIAKHEVLKQSLKVIVRLIRRVCPEHDQILRFAQNDDKRRTLNDSLVAKHPQTSTY